MIDIRMLRPDYDRFVSALGPERQEKVRRFQKEEDRLHSLAAGLLLCKALPVSEETIRYTPEGKPYGTDGTRFSLSHGGNYAALAVMDAEVGVDVEPVVQMDPDKMRIIAERVFTPEEIAWMRETDETERFYILWTKKESVLKADGRGFSLEPNSFSVLSGCRWFSEHIEFDGHIIAAASEVPFSMETHVLTAEEL